MENLLIYILLITILILFLTQSSYGIERTGKDTNPNDKLIIVDGHNDTMMKIIDEKTWLPKIDIGNDTNLHIDIPKLKKGGLNVPFFAAYTHGYYNNTPRSLSRTLALINALHWIEKQNRDDFKIVTSVKDINNAIKEGKIAAVPTIEGAYSIDEDNYKGLLKQYHDLGIRVLGFTWNYANNLGEGASGIYGDPLNTISPKGITKLGKKVVRKMNKLGMIIDVSHISEQTFWDIIKISKDPIIASHSGVYNLKQHQRNLKDDQIKALANNGGVIGVVLYPEFLSDSKEVYIKDYVEHIDYIVNLVGIDYVGIGSDFDGASMPIDLRDSSEIYKIVDELRRRKYSDDDIEKILGKNMIRILEKVTNKVIEDYEINKDIYIIPKYKIGERVLSPTPTLEAKIESNYGYDIDDLRYNIILDGITHKANYNKETSTLYFQIKEPLNEKFHVVTFEAVDKRGRYQRQTRIFYIDAY